MKHIKFLNNDALEARVDMPVMACGSFATDICGTDPEGCGIHSRDCCSVTDGGSCGAGSYDCTDAQG